jgi:hypothetical protein
MVGDMLVGKRYLSKLGSSMNNQAGSGFSTFAQKQMAKMGWTE